MHSSLLYTTGLPAGFNNPPSPGLRPEAVPDPFRDPHDSQHKLKIILPVITYTSRVSRKLCDTRAGMTHDQTPETRSTPIATVSLPVDTCQADTAPSLRCPSFLRTNLCLPTSDDVAIRQLPRRLLRARSAASEIVPRSLSRSSNRALDWSKSYLAAEYSQFIPSA